MPPEWVWVGKYLRKIFSTLFWYQLGSLEPIILEIQNKLGKKFISFLKRTTYDINNFSVMFHTIQHFPPHSFYFTLPRCWCLTIYTRNSLSVFKDPTTACSIQFHGISRRSRKIWVSPLLKKMIQSWGWVLILLTTIRVRCWKKINTLSCCYIIPLHALGKRHHGK